MTTRAQAQARALESMNKAKLNLASLKSDRAQLIADLWVSGLSQRAVARKLGIAVSTVQLALKGSTCPPEEKYERFVRSMRSRLFWTSEMDEALVRMRMEGKFLSECAKTIGVAENTAIKRAKELGVGGRMRLTDRPEWPRP